MFLRAIEMQGFKSFADKTRVEFDPGVTAVVGPNGSGKSNITESLRWALGESSAKSLRGGKMPDVIFAGTENRKPLNYAQVVVTLDNGDGFIPDRDSEIRIERHIYRNGDSDYLIDGKKVRLKDIHDLFMDTGLGRDSFSIISQGRVESIFNSKPEERRAIFEEAAGVLKYKTRKKETQQKLDQTQGNLDRLEDIIHELTSQVGPLAKQAETAQRFQVLDKEREQLQLDILVADIDVDKASQARLEEELAQVRTDLSAYYQRKDQLEEENQALKTRRHQLTDNLSASQEDLVRLTRLVADLERQIEVYHLEENQAAERAALKNQRLAELVDQAETLRSAIAQAKTKREELAAELAATQDKIASLERDLERYGASPDQVMEALREDFVKLVQEEASVSNRLTAIQGELDQQAERSANQSAQRQQVAQDLSHWQEETKAALAKFETSQAQVRDLLATYQTQAQTLQDLSQSYQASQSALFDQLDQLKHKEARQTSLQSILKNHNNFYAGVKSVLQSSQQLGGIIGAVSEHLTFDQSYQTALEVALGASSQQVIVTDEAAAKRAIAFLKQNRQGRATFLPLTTIKPRQLRPDQLDKLTASPGFLGLASDLVSYEPSLGNIFQNLLGMTAIFAELDQANQAARQLNYQVRLVTLDGTELRPGGAFAGGANRQNQTTFIKPELDALNQEIAHLRQDLTQQEDQVKSLKEARERAEADLETIKSQGEAARLTEQKADLEYQQAAQRLADIQRLHDQLGQAGASQTDQELLEEQTQLTKRLTAIASQKADLSDQLTQVKDNKTSLEQAQADLTHRLSQARLTERDLTKEVGFETSTLDRLTRELTQVQQEIAGLELDQAASQMTDQEQLPVLTDQLTTAKSKQEEVEASLVRLRFELEDCEAALEDLAEQVAKASQQNDGLIRQQAKLENQLTNVNERLRNYNRLLTEDYRLSFGDARSAAQPLEDRETARQTLKQLERDIKALGPINLEAIAQHREVQERLDFLSSQKADLDHAKNLLLSTIKEMDDEVKERFQASFEAIRESFRLTFRQMFGGGSADLLLTEGDLLTAGVEISVQPPGKKIQSLNLMSGGEKALSALALLFAIIRVKTIPFVILDEVEAALDEANVKRFGDYLNRFDKSSQFIVVTHRRGTMAAADSIYGVTMQESGVSKIVSVKFTDAEKLMGD